MRIQVDDAILLEVKEESFKGRDGKDVTYRRARFIDDDNQYHEATVASEVEFDTPIEEINRHTTRLVFSVEEVNRNGSTVLKKKVVEA